MTNRTDNLISDLVFKQLKIDDPSNISCFDCGGPHTQYASITNGIFICGNCAKEHRKLNPKISIV